MPDWSYHPFFRPVLFCLPAETSRRITMDLLALQDRLPGGPSMFRALANSKISASLSTEFLGLRFPSPIGVGAGIDVDGRAAPLIQELGAGFVELGPVGLGETPSRHPSRRLRGTQAVAFSGADGGKLLDRFTEKAGRMSIPLGAQLCSSDLVQSVRLLPAAVDFATIPPAAGSSRQLLAKTRAATQRPLLLRVPAGWETDWVERAVENAAGAGIDGIQVAAASPYGGLEEGELVWRGVLPDAMSLIDRIAPTMPVTLAGGVMNPEDAEAALAAGARLVSLSDGLIFAGPGLPTRINRRLGSGPISIPANEETPADDHSGDKPSKFRTWPQAAGITLLAAVGTMIALMGIAYIALASTRTLLPPEVAHVNLDMSLLRVADHSRILDFIAHGRACYGGALLGLGILWSWLAIGPLRRRETWAWWTMGVAGIAFYGGYMDFLAYGYLEPWNAALTFATLVMWAAGLILTKRDRNPGPEDALTKPGAEAWLWSPAGRSRTLLALFGLGLMTAGTMILVIAGSNVFVPQDLQFLGRNPAQLEDLDPHLISLMARDRAGFGGTMLALGISFLAISWKAVRPQAKGAWRILGASGAALVVPAFIAHVAVGYTDLVHLSPVYFGTILLVMALTILRASIWEVAAKEPFPDLDPVRLAVRAEA